MKSTLRLGFLAFLALTVSKPDLRAFHWNGHFFSASVDHSGLHFRTCSQHLASAMLLGPGRYTLATPGMYGSGYGHGGYGCYPCLPTNYYNGAFMNPYCNGQCVTAAPPGSGWGYPGYAGHGYAGYGYPGYGCEGGHCPAPMGAGPAMPMGAAPSVFHQAGYMPAYPVSFQPGYAPWGYYPMSFGR